MTMAFRRIYAAKEAAKGTALALAATATKLTGALTVNPEIGRHNPMDERFSLAEYRRNRITRTDARLDWDGDTIYQYLPMFLGMAVKGGVAAGAVVGDTVSKLYDFTPTEQALNNPDAYTFHYGDDQLVQQLSYVTAESLEITFNPGEVATMRAQLFSHHPATVLAWPGTLPDDATNLIEVLGHEASVYIDDTWADIGGTQKSNLVLGGTLRINSGFVGKRDIESDEDFNYITERRRHWELDLDMKVNADFRTEYAKYSQDGLGAIRAVRLAFDGPDIAASTATAKTKYGFTVSMMGYHMVDPSLLQEREGEDFVRMSIHSAQLSSGTDEHLAVSLTTD